MKTVIEQARALPITAEVDLCVVGGSCTGLFGAVRAARLGLHVALIEEKNVFGGIATAGMVNIWHSLLDDERAFPVIGGLTREILDRLETIGAAQIDERDGAWRLQTEELKLELDALVREHPGIRPFLCTKYCGVLCEEDRITHVLIENKNGRQAIATRFVIDASGDGDVCRDLGLPSYVGAHLQPPTPCYKLYGAQGIKISALLEEHGAEVGLPPDWGWTAPIPGAPDVMMRADTHIFSVNCADADQLTLAEMEGRRQIRAILTLLRRYHPEIPFSLISLPAALGVRETRHYETDFQLTEKQLLSGERFEDAVANGTYRVDVHSDRVGIVFRYLDGHEQIHRNRTSPPEIRRWRPESDTNPRFYQIPFRVMITHRHPNLLIAGRMIHADEGAFGAARVMVNLNQLGEAAGTAAALCLQNSVAPGALSPALLRNTLADGGSIML